MAAFAATGVGTLASDHRVAQGQGQGPGRAVFGTRREPGSAGRWPDLTRLSVTVPLVGEAGDAFPGGWCFEGRCWEQGSLLPRPPFLQIHKEVMLGGLPLTGPPGSPAPSSLWPRAAPWAAGPCSISASALRPPHRAGGWGPLVAAAVAEVTFVLVGRGHTAGRPYSLSFLLIWWAGGGQGRDNGPAGREAPVRGPRANEKVCGWKAEPEFFPALTFQARPLAFPRKSAEGGERHCARRRPPTRSLGRLLPARGVGLGPSSRPVLGAHSSTHRGSGGAGLQEGAEGRGFLPTSAVALGGVHIWSKF